MASSSGHRDVPGARAVMNGSVRRDRPSQSRPRRPAVGNAVRNAHAAKTAARHIQSRMTGERAFDGGHALEMADLVLGVGTFPAINAGQQRPPD